MGEEIPPNIDAINLRAGITWWLAAPVLLCLLLLAVLGYVSLDQFLN